MKIQVEILKTYIRNEKKEGIFYIFAHLHDL